VVERDAEARAIDVVDAFDTVVIIGAIELEALSLAVPSGG
jgi:hypothetical protein